MVEFEQYDCLPTQEKMKARFDKMHYWDVFPLPFKPKKANPYIRDWYWQKGKKPHSHPYGRKPTWRMKRREQRREKRNVENEISQIRERELWPMQYGRGMVK